MKVLSVDFDYFQCVSEEVLRLYPDGIDLPTKESELEWGRKYRSFGDKLAEVGLLDGEFELLKEILNNQQDIHAPVLIANSHLDIYEFIKEQQRVRNDNDLRVVNVDMHHDIFNDHNEILDCGNWVSALQREMTEAGYGMMFQWVVNPVSLGMYGLNEDEWKKVTLPSLDRIRDRQFDAVFLCRSDMWLAPHLDKAFAEVCDLIVEHFDNVELRDDVDLPRKTGDDLVRALEKFERKAQSAERE